MGRYSTKAASKSPPTKSYSVGLLLRVPVLIFGGALAWPLAAQVRGPHLFNATREGAISDTVAREGGSSTHRTQCPHFHATGDWCTADAASSGSALHAPHRLFLPRAVHLARSRLRSRPHTCVLSRETRRDAQQSAGGSGGRHEGTHSALAFARALAAGWPARCAACGGTSPHTAEL